MLSLVYCISFCLSVGKRVGSLYRAFALVPTLYRVQSDCYALKRSAEKCSRNVVCIGLGLYNIGINDNAFVFGT